MVRDLIPWRRKRSAEGVARRHQSDHPITELQREMNDLFESFFGDSEMGLTSKLWGDLRSSDQAGSFSVDVTESDKEIRVTADVPGIDEQDLDIELTDNLLTIRGEKRQEKEEKESSYHLIERSWGSFQRSIPLPAGIEAAQAKARFKNGVLTITLPKSAEAQERRKLIPISTT